MKLEDLNISHFQPYLGETFEIRLDTGEDYGLELAQVEDLGEAPFAGARRPFSLIFYNPNRAAYLPQHTYHCHHSALGDLEIFITPLGPDQRGMRYQAIFA